MPTDTTMVTWNIRELEYQVPACVAMRFIAVCVRNKVVCVWRWWVFGDDYGKKEKVVAEWAYRVNPHETLHAHIHTHIKACQTLSWIINIFFILWWRHACGCSMTMMMTWETCSMVSSNHIQMIEGKELACYHWDQSKWYNAKTKKGV